MTCPLELGERSKTSSILGSWIDPQLVLLKYCSQPAVFLQWMIKVSDVEIMIAASTASEPIVVLVLINQEPAPIQDLFLWSIHTDTETDIWSKPQVIPVADKIEPVEAKKFILDKNEVNQFEAVPEVPTHCLNQLIRVARSIVSKVVLRSYKTNMVHSPESTTINKSFITLRTTCEYKDRLKLHKM